MQVQRNYLGGRNCTFSNELNDITPVRHGKIRILSSGSYARISLQDEHIAGFCAHNTHNHLHSILHVH